MSTITLLAWSVTPSVGNVREPCKTADPDRDAVWDADLSGPNEPCVRQVSRSPPEVALLRGSRSHREAL